MRALLGPLLVMGIKPSCVRLCCTILCTEETQVNLPLGSLRSCIFYSGAAPGRWRMLYVVRVCSYAAGGAIAASYGRRRCGFPCIYSGRSPKIKSFV